jgi:hypothetical protein
MYMYSIGAANKIFSGAWAWKEEEHLCKQPWPALLVGGGGGHVFLPLSSALLSEMCPWDAKTNTSEENVFLLYIYIQGGIKTKMFWEPIIRWQISYQSQEQIELPYKLVPWIFWPTKWPGTSDPSAQRELLLDAFGHLPMKTTFWSLWFSPFGVDVQGQSGLEAWLKPKYYSWNHIYQGPVHDTI